MTNPRTLSPRIMTQQERADLHLPSCPEGEGGVRGATKGGKRSRDKGNRTERAIVAAFQNVGFAAERVPLSGAARGRFGGDLSIPFLGSDKRVEVKCRGTGFNQLYAWLAKHDYLIVKADRKEPLFVLRMSEAIEIAKLVERSR